VSTVHTKPTTFPEVARAFAIDGTLREARRYGNGHINDTLLATWDTPDGPRRFIHQRLNHRVFPDLPALMANVERVCSHLARIGVPAGHRLELVPGRDHQTHVIDAEGRWWRCYPFIEGTCTRERVRAPADAAAAGSAFGEFLGALATLPDGALHEVIPAFHHTPTRLSQLAAAQRADPLGRAAGCAAELAFVDRHRELASILSDAIADGTLPLRATHNDCKLNNVLLDAHSGAGRCVIDLDTLMPGSPLFDLGDLLRTSVSTGAEDDSDPQRIDIDLAVLRAALTGFVGAMGDRLEDGERRLLPWAGPVLTFECGLRFLADHLRGDRYFKIHRPDHNLVRARAQFALVAAFRRHAAAIADICAEVTA